MNTVTFVASATASRARSDDEAMLGIVEEERKSHRPVPSPPGGQMGVVDDLCVSRRPQLPVRQRILKGVLLLDPRSVFRKTKYRIS